MEKRRKWKRNEGRDERSSQRKGGGKEKNMRAGEKESRREGKNK